MPDVVLVRHRFYPRVWPARPIEIPLADLQTVMDAANRHFAETPGRELGGPTLPAAGRA